MTFNPITGKILALLIIMLFIEIVVCFADNPPLPCNITWQQGGLLYQGELYQYGYPLPKQPYDYWAFTNTRPGYNYSYGWFHLECGRPTPPVNVPFDDHFYLISFIFVIFISYKTYQHDKRTITRNC